LFADSLQARASTTRRAFDWEFIAEAIVLSAVLTIGLTTAADFGTTVDEFNTEPYGHQALAWYLSGFTNDALFHNPEWIHLYGPWSQILIAIAQSISPADPLTVRHAMTFVIGMLGIAALGPIARLTIGRWAGLTAIVLCLITGYVYGHLFFSPIDVPFMTAMTWATLAIIVMTRRVVPSWPAVIGAGMALGLAVGTRPGGVIAQVYCVGAASLCAVEILAKHRSGSRAALGALALRTGAAIIIAWLAAIALWPWLQIGNPLRQFWNAFTNFTKLDMSFEFQHWGSAISTYELPWHYIPGQLLARLADPFVALLLLSLGLAVVHSVRFAIDARRDMAARGSDGVRATALALARARGLLVVAVAALSPIVLVIVLDTTIYDGVRHILFAIPMLALLASWGFVHLLPLMRKAPAAAGAGIGVLLGAAVATLVALHPLQYVAINSLSGGTKGAYGRFELDYWSAAATLAIRRLEQRLDQASERKFPKVMVCIGWREALVAPLFRRDWEVTTSQHDADFLIETERFPCAEGTGAVLIDEVRRAGRSFARTYAMQRGP
jgi:hypothetical protein